MKRKFDKRLLAVLFSVMMTVMIIPNIVYADDGGRTDGDGATRTIMLYCCGSDLEARASMATFNLRQILGSRFSASGKVRFLILTGGAKGWHLEDEKLSDPNHIGITMRNGKKTISGEYNQIWEAKGIDAVDEAGDPDENAGRLVLLDGDGITSNDPVRNQDELMSDPKTLKAFINYCVEYAPADKYDLILWDHGGGPAYGYASDMNNPDKENDHMMLLPEIVDAISDNAVTNHDADHDGRLDKFDFIDFDACVMNCVELIMTLADYTDYYIASPQTEPGYGQYYGPADGDYKGWLDEIGDPEKAETYDQEGGTFELGKVIVDDFLRFYREGPGEGSEGTLSVVNMQELVAPETGFVQALTDLNDILRSQAIDKSADGAYQFYDEFDSAVSSIMYNGGAFFDLGNFVGQLAVPIKEVSKAQTPDENPYIPVAKKILSTLDDDTLIYGGGTDNVRADASFSLDKEGKLRFEDQYTSGMYTFFPTTDGAEETLQYCNSLKAAIEEMPSSGAEDRKALLNASIAVAADYSLIAESGIAVSDLLNPYEAPGTAREDIDYAKVEEYWKDDGGAEPLDGVDFSPWSMKIEPLMTFSGADSAKIREWLQELVQQQAKEAVSNDSIEVYSVNGTGERNGTRVVFNETSRKIIDSVNVNVVAELPYAEEYIENDPFLSEYKFFIPEFSIGSVSGTESLDDLEVSTDPDRFMENYIKWYNSGTSAWDLDPVPNKWYALKDSDDTLHAAAVEFTKEGNAVLISYDDEDGSRAYAYLCFNDTGTGNEITDIYFISGDSMRPVKASELKTELKDARTEQMIMLAGLLQEYIPLSEPTFDITPENLSTIKLEYTDVGNIPDIRDTDGDGEALRFEYAAKDIYCNEFDFSPAAESPSGELTDIKKTVIKSATYNGKAQNPVVTYNGTVLTEGVVYTLIKLTDQDALIEAGEYIVALHGRGRFCGIDNKVFRIAPADISKCKASLSKKTYAYTRKAIKPAIKVTGVNASAYAVSYSGNTKVGSASYTITAKGTNYKGSIKGTFRIVPKKAVIKTVTAGKKKLTVKAKTAVGKTGGTVYEIQYRAKGDQKWKKLTTKKRSRTIKKLQKGKKYQVKIRAFRKVGGKTYYGAFSKTKTVKVK